MERLIWSQREGEVRVYHRPDAIWPYRWRSPRGGGVAVTFPVAKSEALHPRMLSPRRWLKK